MVFSLIPAMEVAKADFVIGTPTNLGPTVNSAAVDWMPSLSADGLTLYFSSRRSGGFGSEDIYVTTRATTGDPWEEPVNLGPPVNTSNWEQGPSISADGLTLFFSSYNRPDGSGGDDIYVTTREKKDDPWGTPMNLGPTVNSSAHDWAPSISADGLTLYFGSRRSGGYGGYDLWVTIRETIHDEWGSPVNLGGTVNSAHKTHGMSISHDGLLLFFSSDRPGGSGGFDFWVTRRETTNDPWGTPVNLGPPVNSSAYYDQTPNISADGSTLYFTTERPGDFGNGDIYQALVIPIVDLNGDGIVDSMDICIMVDHWGTDNSLCDIGPMPWGDGVVDVQDLIVLAEHLFEVLPSAETVEVNEGDDGGQVELELGKLLVVTLESNPSTGYRWELLENNDSVLKQFGEAEFKPSVTSEPPMVGAGGWEIFRFKAVSAGQITLELVYHRSWEDVEPLKTFSIQVVVR